MMDQSAEEIRKIQFTGKSTYIISLPKKWVTSHGLNAGSQIIVSQKNGSLILTPKEVAKTETKNFEATLKISESDDPDIITRQIISLYLVGYSSIRVLAKDERISAAQRNAIKDLVRKKLVGTEIISETPNEIKMQILIGYPEISVESALRRMCLIAASMHEDAIKALRSLDRNLAQEVVQLDDEVDRFNLYVIRQLKAAAQDEKILRDIGLSSPRDCLGYRVIVKSVERIADHAASIAGNVLLLEEEPNEEIFQKIMEVSIFAKTVFEDAIKSLFKRDYFMADQVISKAKTISLIESKIIREAQSKVKQTDISNMRMIMESIRRTAEYASDIAEIVLNLNINQIITA
ncbi:MAG: AbrB/MazE/SpoVT family DNA-binding domain-containing protein [Candidatus Bathyarchaeota archaeon]|nr:AbrB/MazE/SpoVT family DNA-binding domain-containing protein [Candidatus Bathyarchaeota archaeon]